MPEVRAVPVLTCRAALYALMIVGSLAAFFVGPQAAQAAGVSGQQQAPWGEYGTGTGQLWNPKQLGVDPVDGSVFVLSSVPGFNEVRLEKYSSTGSPEASRLLSRTPDEPTATGVKGFVGIAVDHEQGHEGVVYVVQQEEGLSEEEPEALLATKVLAFSTGNLTPATPISLPGPTDPGALFWVNEIHVDPSNHELVLSALASPTEPGVPVLQRITKAGLETHRYQEAGSHLIASPGAFRFAFAVGGAGTTYILSSKVEFSIEGFTLPPHFEPPSGPLTLGEIPGFAAAAPAEGWSSGSVITIQSTPFSGVSWGPQIALTVAPGGEETLLWKSGVHNEPHVNVTVHGYSLQQEATNVAYGGFFNKAPPECSIESRTAAIEAAPNGSLVVLDQGQEVSNVSSTPAWGPNVFQFGPGGESCPAPAPSFKIEPGASVASTAAVTLNAEESENDSTEQSIAWKVIKKSDSSVAFEQTVQSTDPHPLTAEVPPGTLSAGEYTIRMKMKVSPAVGSVGNTFVAKPKPLMVTAGAPAPTVTGVSPTEGTTLGGTTVTITGTGFTGASCPAAVKFEATTAASCNVVDATHISAVSPAHAAGKVHVTVTNGGQTSATSAADEFEYKTPVAAPTVTAVSPSSGTAVGGTQVTITGTNLTGATQIKFGTTAVTCDGTVAHCKVESATQIKATTPAHAAGAVDVRAVVGGTESAANPPGDQFTYNLDTHSLTIVKGGAGAGGVSCNGISCASTYTAGTSVTLSAAPASGSTFAGWQGGGCVGTGNCTVVLTTDITVTAVFNVVQSNSGGSSNSGSTATTTTPPTTTTTPPNSGKTEAEKLKERRKNALAKCKKMHGKAKAKCVKRANQIGKPKASKKRETGAFGIAFTARMAIW